MDSRVRVQVKVANGAQIEAGGWCRGVPFVIQGNTFLADFFVLSLGGCDVVFDVHWLRTLGGILWYLLNLSMSFSLFKISIILKGLKMAKDTVDDTSKFNKLLGGKRRGVVLQFLTNGETIRREEPSEIST